MDECQEDKDYNTCDGNATCTNNVGSYECECLEGFVGNGLQCIDIQECLDPRTNDCDEGIIFPTQFDGPATCVNSPGGYVCDCGEGFSGNGMDLASGGEGCVDIDECLTDPCNDDVKEECANTIGSYVCTCIEGRVSAVEADSLRFFREKVEFFSSYFFPF